MYLESICTFKKRNGVYTGHELWAVSSKLNMQSETWKSLLKAPWPHARFVRPPFCSPKHRRCVGSPYTHYCLRVSVWHELQPDCDRNLGNSDQFHYGYMTSSAACAAIKSAVINNYSICVLQLYCWPVFIFKEYCYYEVCGLCRLLLKLWVS
jgi:hypothetical protein